MDNIDNFNYEYYLNKLNNILSTDFKDNINIHNDIKNIISILVCDIENSLHIYLKKFIFDKFHPYFSLKLTVDKACEFGAIYSNSKAMISYLILNNVNILSDIDIEALIYCYYDEVTSIVACNFYLDELNHFTTKIQIQRFSEITKTKNNNNNNNKCKNSCKVLLIFCEVVDYKINDKVNLKCYVNQLNNKSIDLYQIVNVTFKQDNNKNNKLSNNIKTVPKF